jgi:hypothetical protein
MSEDERFEFKGYREPERQHIKDIGKLLEAAEDLGWTHHRTKRAAAGLAYMKSLVPDAQADDFPGLDEEG